MQCQVQTSFTPTSSTPTQSTNPLQVTSAGELDAEQLQALAKLRSLDQEVRAHEQAHQNAAGHLAQGMSLDYQRGADGNRYAVGGEVSIDTSKVSGDPQATLEKAQTILKAALAPAEPSSQDRQVAAQAQQMISEARAAIASQQQQEAQGNLNNYQALSTPKASLGLDLTA